MTFGSNPADLFGKEDDDEGALLSQDTSLSGQVAQQWKRRARAQEAALKEAANSKFRRLLAYNKSFNCADIAVGDFFLRCRVAKVPRNGENLRRTSILTKLGRRRHFKVRHLRWLDIACGKVRG